MAFHGRTTLRVLAGASLVALGTTLAPAVQAQAFPSKTLKFVVPFGPGSGTDTSARYFARKLQDLTGQSVVVENKPGANGFIAVKQVLSAPADGYTVFIGSNSTLAVNAALFKELPYDPVKDFAPLTMMMRAPAMLVVPPGSPNGDLKSLIAYAKAHPGELSYGSSGSGSSGCPARRRRSAGTLRRATTTRRLRLHPCKCRQASRTCQPPAPGTSSH